MNIINIIIIKDHLFHKGLRPLVTVSTADIPVLHSSKFVHFTRESCCPYAWGHDSHNTFKVSRQGTL